MTVAENQSVEETAIANYEKNRVAIAIANLKEEDVRVIEAWLTAEGDECAAARRLGWRGESFGVALSKAFARLRRELSPPGKDVSGNG